MKNFLIYSFFVVMISLSGLTMIFGATIVTKKIDVNYRTISEDLDDNQIEYYNRKQTFETPIEFTNEYRNVLRSNVREIRTKGIFGWETHIDTLNRYVNTYKYNQ